MPTKDDQLASIRNNGFVMERFLYDHGAPTDYDVPALVWIEKYLLHTRDRLQPDDIDLFVAMAGAFLGQCICKNYGGAWLKADGAWGVAIDINGEILLANTFAKVSRLIEYGHEQSMVAFYMEIGVMLDMAYEHYTDAEEAPE
ncbi:MAG: hypothetical protein AAFV33_20990 [Chloroflexota bacterium]